MTYMPEKGVSSELISIRDGFISPYQNILTKNNSAESSNDREQYGEERRHAYMYAWLSQVKKVPRNTNRGLYIYNPRSTERQLGHQKTGAYFVLRIKELKQNTQLFVVSHLSSVIIDDDAKAATMCEEA